MFRTLIIILFTCSGVFANDFIAQLDGQISVRGQKIKAKDLKGKVLLIDYWGMHCNPCIAALPKLQKLHDKYSKTGKFMLIASHVATGDKAKIAQFMTSKKYTFSTLRYFHLKNSKGIIPCSSLPHLFLVDHHGKIVEQGYHIADLDKKISLMISHIK